VLGPECAVYTSVVINERVSAALGQGDIEVVHVVEAQATYMPEIQFLATGFLKSSVYIKHIQGGAQEVG
tara:strand:+ start:626 stop:832 length:207 start_codon:yes stop_codon:yes gene_type:complete